MLKCVHDVLDPYNYYYTSDVKSKNDLKSLNVDAKIDPEQVA